MMTWLYYLSTVYGEREYSEPIKLKPDVKKMYIL